MMELSLPTFLWILVPLCFGQPIQVFDNVLSESVRQELDEFIATWPNPDVVFEHPLLRPDQANKLEQVLSQIIDQLYTKEEEYYVEYWTRREWVNTLAHADQDEGRLPIRHPPDGHVLYLFAGTHVTAPTCVFDSVIFGGQLLQQEYSESGVDLYIVPPVPSRLLQFDGRLLHAAPKPAGWDVYNPKWQDRHEPHEQYGRSVVLFNTWPKKNGPLLTAAVNQPTCTKDCIAPPNNLSRPFPEWKKVPIQERKGGEAVYKLDFPLLGDEGRRGTERETITMKASRDAMYAFAQRGNVTVVRLYPERKSWFSFVGFEL